MKHLSIFIFLALVSTFVYSQTSIRVEGSPAVITLNTDGTYCYQIDPDNFPKNSEITQTVEQISGEILEGVIIAKNDSHELIAIKDGTADVELRDGKYFYVIHPENLPVRKQEIDIRDSDIEKEKQD